MAIGSHRGWRACMEQSPKHSRTQLLLSASQVPLTRYHSRAPASHTSTGAAPCGVIAQPQENAIAFAAPQPADPPRPRPRTAGPLRTMVAELGTPQLSRKLPPELRWSCQGETTSILSPGVSSTSSSVLPRTLVFGAGGKALLSPAWQPFPAVMKSRQGLTSM